MTPQEMVKQFHQTFGMPVSDSLQALSIGRRKLRLELILEEAEELVEASAFDVAVDVNRVYTRHSNPSLTAAKDLKVEHVEGQMPSIVSMADGLGDLVYVCYGMALEMGIDLDAVIAEIHRSNMSKLGADGKPIYRADGKVLKGPDYTPPNIAGVIYFQGEQE